MAPSVKNDSVHDPSAIGHPLGQEVPIPSSVNDDAVWEKALAAALPHTMFHCSRDGRIVGYKPTEDFVPPVPPEQFLGRPLCEIFPSDVADRLQCAMEKTLATRQVQDLEYTMMLHGKCHCYAGKVTAVNDAEAIVILKDITAQKKTEDKISHERNLLRTLIENLPAQVFVKDRQSRFLVFNQRVAKYYPWLSPAEIMGKTDFDVFPRDVAERYYAEEQAIMQTGVPIINQESCRIVDGEEVWCSSTKVPLRDESGEIIGLVGIGQSITDIHHAKKKLAEREAMLQSILRSAPVGIGMVSQRMLIWVNDKICQITGYSNEELIGQSARMLYLSDEEFDRVGREKYDQIKREGTGIIETRWRRQDGRVIDVWLSSTPVDPDHWEKGVTFSVMDITDRKATERQLRETSQLLETIFNAIPDLLGIQDAHHHIIRYNQAGCDFLGKTPAEIIGRRCYEIMEQVLPCTPCATSLAYQSKKPERLERYDDKLDRWLEVRSYPVLDETGNVVKVVEHLRDITDQKKAEDAVRQERDRAQNYLDIAGVIFVALDHQGHVTLINKKGCQILGYRQNEILGTSWFDLCIPASMRDMVKTTFSLLMAGQTTAVEYYENLIQSCTGSERLIAWHNTTLADKNGKIIGTLSSGIDITEERRVQQQVWEYQNQLRLLARDLTLAEERERQYLANELHDGIGQDLALSLLKLQSTRQESPPVVQDQLEQVAGLIEQAIQDMRGVVFDLGSPMLHITNFEEAVEDWLAEQLQGKYQISYEFTNDGRPKNLDDDVGILLFRAVREILINVIKHARTKQVKVDIHRQDAIIRITVQDNGIGFDTAIIRSARSVGKSGFGLFSVRERLDHMGGRFEVISSPGQGTRVIMEAPLKKNTNTTGGLS